MPSSFRRKLTAFRNPTVQMRFKQTDQLRSSRFVPLFSRYDIFARGRGEDFRQNWVRIRLGVVVVGSIGGSCVAVAPRTQLVDAQLPKHIPVIFLRRQINGLRLLSRRERGGQGQETEARKRFARLRRDPCWFWTLRGWLPRTQALRTVQVLFKEVAYLLGVRNPIFVERCFDLFVWLPIKERVPGSVDLFVDDFLAFGFKCLNESFSAFVPNQKVLCPSQQVLRNLPCTRLRNIALGSNCLARLFTKILYESP
ncbi:hypothetical protein Poly51_58960 [Rubripirellula tenax]|uniref:Uncharacterized protein n=1 Tax=Rubripirellula tenax TaxID=2528015 RepID=A0A5C6E7M5_9BACT|nr:hypothetical protein Poly51_58960 [Rubripirellula tenax]